jgi:hypothetical protein
MNPTEIKKLSALNDHDLMLVHKNMGEAWEILRGFERGDVSPAEAKRSAKKACSYLSTAQESLEEVREKMTELLKGA